MAIWMIIVFVITFRNTDSGGGGGDRDYRD
jgi:hypothetical protein